VEGEKMNGYGRDQANAKGWIRITAALGVVFLSACVTTVVTRKSTDDWLPVILFAAMAGLCTYAALVLTVMYYRVRREHTRSTTNQRA
jgi:hypothetical protein